MQRESYRQDGKVHKRTLCNLALPDFPGERLIACRNPDLAAERARKREELLMETETELFRIKAATSRKRNLM